MEEKDRYEFKYNEKIMKHYMFDNLTKTQLGYEDITNLLNQQDKRIKELEEINDRVWCARTNADDTVTYLEQENQQLRHQIRELKKEIDYLKFDNAELIDTINSYKALNLQQLHDLSKKIVGEIEKCFTEYLPLKDKTGAWFYGKLNEILKKYGNNIPKRSEK